jgi:5-formaminoimidazole-4-carboxamide-1-(beta)-D-ribofuranosyl 5'-monophosphate synthetase
MIDKQKILQIVENYDKKHLTLATFCSHTSLQIFAGAKAEGFRTIGIYVGNRPKFYDAFPRGKPDVFMEISSYENLGEKADELISQNTILIPHGSFVEYLGAKNFENLKLPTFGNRRVLEWEANREKERIWLKKAGVTVPIRFKKPEDIDRPVIIKYYGAKGGKDFFIAKNYNEFKQFEDKLIKNEPYIIQEYVLGTRYYIHYFYSPIKNDGYKLSKGSLEILGMDRRDEANIDEMYKLGSQEMLKQLGIYPTFVVTGNVPLVIRESLLDDVCKLGEKVVEASLQLFGGVIGPFCLETIVTDKCEFRVFEISARIVAGTNLYITGSPYSELVADGLSTGRRIAIEIKNALQKNMLYEIIS